jgi:D-serine deaminase-like pyridoxal phosphate-dependent protein
MTLSPNMAALADVETPALVLDAAALDRNIAHMAAIAQRRGVALRPHAKTHKSPDIARRQIAAGAVGVCCATLLEAEAMTDAGIGGLLITAPTFGGARFERIAALNRRRPLQVVVDHLAQVEGLAAAMRPDDPVLGVLVDVDVGQRRTGVIDVGDALAITRRIAASPGLRFAGLQGYAGHVQHITDAGERRVAAEAAASLLGAFAQALTGAGFRPAVISGSGTGAHGFDLEAGPYTELQVGSYALMDADYARVLDERGHGPDFLPALMVLATVVSVSRVGEVTVDAGTKVLATNGPPPCHLLGVPPGSVYRFGGDEHGIVTLPAGGAAPRLGDRLLIGATHCDPTVNLHDRYLVVRGEVLEHWPIVGRHGGR